jgi:hypothetical protein
VSTGNFIYTTAYKDAVFLLQREKMSSQSQSQSTAEDSRFTELLKPIKDLTQNFEVGLLVIPM